jgi:dihydrofolate reductase
VYSATLRAISTARTRIERDFDPGAVRRMKVTLDGDITVGGPGLAAHALRAGLVDECRLFLNPVVVGGGTPSLPDGVRLDLELLEERRFGNGVVYLRDHVMARAVSDASLLVATRRTNSRSGSRSTE